MNAHSSIQFEIIHNSMDKEVLGHETRVAIILSELTSFIPADIKASYGLSEDNLRTAYFKGGQYHDVGKVAYRYSLFKTVHESTCHTLFHILRKHTIYGRDYLLEYADGLFVNDTEKEICTDMAMYHHERHDGHSCFEELAVSIPFAAQLCSVVNTFDNYVMASPFLLGKKYACQTAYEKTMSDTGFAEQKVFDCFAAGKDLIMTYYCSKQSAFHSKRMLDKEQKLSEEQRFVLRKQSE